MVVLIVTVVTVLVTAVVSGICRLYYLRLIAEAYRETRDPAVLGLGAQVLTSWPEKVVPHLPWRPPPPADPPAVEAKEEQAR